MAKKTMVVQGQVPPQAIDIEEAVLGAILIEQPAFMQVIDLLQPDYFYKPAHKEVYQAILELFAQANPVDMLTVTQQLRQTGKLEMAGGPAFVMKLTSLVNSSANIVYHAHILVEQAIKRRLIEISSKIRKAAFDHTSDAFEVIDDLANDVFQLSETGIKKQFSRASKIVSENILTLEEDVANPQRIQKNKIPSGLYSLDKHIGGFDKATLTVLAARPAMGKTAFALNLALNAAEVFERPVAFFSLEMSARELGYRLLAMCSGIASKRIKNRALSQEEVPKIRQAEKLIQKPNLFIDDTPQLSLLQFKAKVRRLVFSHQVECVIIDYLQLMKGHSGQASQNRQLEVATIVKDLKALAKEMDIPIIALSQLNRGVETRPGDKRPVMADLRESGEIEQSADTIAFLYRPAYYGVTEDHLGNSTEGVTELIIAKHRDGKPGTILLEFVPQHLRFQDLNQQFWREPTQKPEQPGRATQSLPAKQFRGFSQNPDDFDK
ncbi:replicative DNA helicase [uncultured Microscilla sp.]|uniref:replicative DNA helicase n=1 Tax=uncultured Microscilla sp. TaxID=432653 RepID=UPI002611957E|nr:replicative DNA helicase [uncultured Microscilla sp.]